MATIEGSDPGFAPRLLMTGALVASTAALRAAARGAAISSQHTGAMVMLGRDSAQPGDEGATARAMLRDEVLELWRELAWSGWHEARRAIDEFDERTRPSDAYGDPWRRARYKS
jgi:hypothetical protein